MKAVPVVCVCVFGGRVVEEGRRKERRKGREEGEGGRRERGQSSEIEPLAILIFNLPEKLQ